jgi:hypothetical protein
MNIFEGRDSWDSTLRYLKKRKAWDDYKAGRSPTDVKLFQVWDRIMSGCNREDQLSKWNEFKDGFLDLERAEAVTLTEAAASAAVVKFRAWDSAQSQPESFRQLLKWWDEAALARNPSGQVEKFNAMLASAGSPNRYALPKHGDDTVTAEDATLARSTLKKVTAITAVHSKLAKQGRAKRVSKGSTANKPDTNTNRPKKKS